MSEMTALSQIANLEENITEKLSHKQHADMNY